MFAHLTQCETKDCQREQASERGRERMSIKGKCSLAVTAWEKANRRERVSKKNSYYRHYIEGSRRHGNLTTNNPVKLKLCEQEQKEQTAAGQKQGNGWGGRKKKHFCTMKKAGHSWRALGIKAVTGSHNTAAAKQEVVKQQRWLQVSFKVEALRIWEFLV